MATMEMPSHVRIVEVGPRDGLQNERTLIPTSVKLELIERLVCAGLREIEVTAFVSPRWVPQMADHGAVLAGLVPHAGVRHWVLIPNRHGLDAALAAGARHVAVFPAASETFSQRNLNCSIATALARCGDVVAAASAAGSSVRGYISCALGCPYEGNVEAARVADLADALLAMGCAELSLADTIGAGTPGTTWRLWDAVLARVPPARLAGHFHDTGGMAIANILASLQVGITTFDSAVAGLGGCPYAPGASGNVATEDLVHLLAGLGIETGVDADLLAQTGDHISRLLGRPSAARSRAHCQAPAAAAQAPQAS